MFDRKSGYGRWLLLAVWSVLALGACASAPDPEVVLPRAVLLAPTRFDPRLADRLEPGAHRLDELIGRLLWERDVRVSAPPQPDFRVLWKAAAEGVALEPDAPVDLEDVRYDAAVVALTHALHARGVSFDALLLPYLTVRPGAVQGHAVMWDGVTRRLPFSQRKPAADFLLSRRGIQAPCTSLRVIAYDARGERLFERLGGLEVARQVTLTRDGSGRSWSDREDLFQDPRALRDGVEVALGPLLRR
jgi:hypothetical protein